MAKIAGKHTTQNVTKGKCRECGLVSVGGGRLYCSKECRRKAQNRRAAEKRRAFIASVMGESAKPVEAQEKAQFMQRLLGMGLVGAGAFKRYFPIFHGARGNNGKDTLFETLRDVLGPDLCSMVKPSVLLSADRNEGSEGATPFLMVLKGKRIVYASETEKRARLSAAQVKSITGGTQITGRGLHQQTETFPTSHLIFLITNEEPEIGTDEATWNRVIKIPFDVKYCLNPDASKGEEPIIEGLADSLKEEASGILAWLVQGCLEWQRNNHDLQIPTVLQTAKEKYKAREDKLGGFIAENCQKGNELTHKTVLKAFCLAYNEYTGERLTPRDMSAALRARGYKVEAGTGNLTTVYGVALLALPESDF